MSRASFDLESAKPVIWHRDEDAPDASVGGRDLVPVVHVMWSMEIGGAERAVYQLVREQRNTGRRSDVLVAARIGHYADALRREGALAACLRQRHALDPRGLPLFGRVLREYRIVHFHGAEPLLMLAASGIPGLSPVYTHRSGTFAYPLRRNARYRCVAPLVRKHFTVSANTRQAAHAAASLFGIPTERVALTRNGIDFSLLSPRSRRGDVLAEIGAPHQTVRIGTSANLRGWKRIDRLIRAVGRLRAEQIHCVIIGDGSDRVPLERLVDRLGISGLVTFTGRVEHVGDYLQVLDIFVLPSGPEESFGNAAVEAMGMGIPAVVFTDGGGLLEHVADGRNGFVVENEDQLTLRLRQLIRDESRRRALGMAAQRTVTARYGLRSMLRAYDELYRRAAGARPLQARRGVKL